jgi:hypothetical protein
MTMDLYVHVTNDELISEFDKIKADLVVWQLGCVENCVEEHFWTK